MATLTLTLEVTVPFECESTEFMTDDIWTIVQRIKESVNTRYDGVTVTVTQIRDERFGARDVTAGRP